MVFSHILTSWRLEYPARIAKADKDFSKTVDFKDKISSKN